MLVADSVGFPMIEFITQVIVFTEYKKKTIITRTNYLAKLKSGF